MKNGEALKKSRLDRHMSQAELAKESGVSLRAIRSYEQGDRDINKAAAETVIALADALEVHPKEIMNGFEHDYRTWPGNWEMEPEEIIDQGLYEQAVEMMDKEIRDRLHDKLAPCTELEFLEAYMTEHLKKFREPFILP